MELCLTVSGLQMDRVLLRPTLTAIFCTLDSDPMIDTRYCRSYTVLCADINKLNVIEYLD